MDENQERAEAVEAARKALTETMLQQASLFQDAWQLQLEMWDGAVAEAQRHGWTEQQARVLVWGTLVKNFGLS